MNVGLVFGGPSVEHDISIITANQIYVSINKNKYNIIPIYYSKEKRFYLPKNFGLNNNFLKDINLLEEIDINRLEVKKKGKFAKKIKIDCVIGAFHGKNTESGELAGFFETLDIPYSFNSVLGASIGQDKIIMKKVLQSDNINVLPFIGFNHFDYNNNKNQYINNINKMGYPVIIKPSMLGSSIGIKVITDEKDLEKGLNLAFKYDEYIIVEKALTNFREFNCAIFDDLLSDIEEVEVKNEIFTFNDKYQDQQSKHILPALISEELKNEIYKMTKETSKSLRNESIARIDFLYDNNENTLYVNEINTIPGALSYYLFESKGIYFDELLDKLITETMKRDYKKRLIINNFTSSVLDNNNGLKMKK